jgi:tryptophan synthase beta subunit
MAVLINLSGRGDKDVHTLAQRRATETAAHQVSLPE